MYVSGLRNFPTGEMGEVPLHQPKITSFLPPGKMSPVDSPQPNLYSTSPKVNSLPLNNNFLVITQ